MKLKYTALDTFQIVGFVVSVAISVGLVVSGQDTVASVTLGLVLGTLTQLFDLQIRHSASEERLLQANALSRALYSDEAFLRRIRQIVDDYVVVKNGWFDLYKLRADDAVIECQNVLHSMAEGYMVANIRSPFTFGAEAVRQVEKSLKGVASAEVSYWRSTHAKKYLQVQAEAVQRGVEITRVFIQPASVIPGMIDILKTQRQLGVEVYVAIAETTPRDLNEDYLIMDNRVFTRLELTGDGYAREERISIDAVEVERMVKKFDMLLRHARKLDDMISEFEQPSST